MAARTSRGNTDTPALDLRVLGELEIIWRGERLDLGLSRKTRALCGYLLVTGRPHRRSDLCDLLWEGPEDPRGSLRWSLSRIRRSLGPAAHCLEAVRDRVWVRTDAARLDLSRVQALVGKGATGCATADLRAAALEFRGELLAGLNLDDSFRFRAWCLAEREHLRGLHIGVLRTLVDRLRDIPEEALGYASAWAVVDPLAEAAHATLVRLLGRLGRKREALVQYEVSRRTLEEEVGPAETAELEAARRGLGPVAPHAPMPRKAASVSSPGLVGRSAERSILKRRVDDLSRGEAAGRLLLVTGEAGLGKSRLLEFLADRVTRSSGRILAARCFESEAGRAYGAWIDALGDRTEVWRQARSGGDATKARERLFDSIASHLRELARERPTAILLDDVQWGDEASLGLLHFVARRMRDEPSLLVAAAARMGEILDRPVAARVLRSLLAEGLVDELRLAPLGEADALALAAASGSPSSAERASRLAEGNPLFTIEAARAIDAGDDDLGATLDRLIEMHCVRLPAEAQQFLGWAAALGREFDLFVLSAAGQWPPAVLAEIAAGLERRGLLRPLGEASYDFAHGLYREAAYRLLGGPRRRLAHAQIARVLAARVDADGERAAELARHAELGGEPELAARACLRAAERCLRLFAVAEAVTLAERGRGLATALPPRGRISLETSLLRLLVLAGAHRHGGRVDLEQSLEAVACEAEAASLHADVAAGRFALFSRLPRSRRLHSRP